ncbi:putative steroid monooxygenase [Caenibius tardaugens NBRC 16725]|uniref:Putative steroid monooxygenase n=1 Tax=Caenibius tardaugens NBRC 16725 TaxID=1219035 RepID=U2ZXD9_9SPHN|nr:NAD(P)/FAD-dependent oxidoreductase [Caenibius tardaugens]AZI35659.1 NAD(P)/FAD-dependent oxidoreductase [Caenibius tardaugens NBRC 16725]GAD50054.1 putative steroid monooxygenase [Caenibius tardaugens NBRC 16725]
MSGNVTEELDICIIGAGFSGLYATYRLKNDYNVVCLEAGSGVGGTWFWNRYPGARVDIQSVEYSYGFDEELQQEWQWPEYFSDQPELERYANHVADRFDLRGHIRLSTVVTHMRFDETANRWHVHTDKGDHFLCRYVIAATGSLSAANSPDWPDRDLFRGDIYHTTQWPREGLDLSGKRVGLIGTGSTGIQAAPILAQQAEHLTVFQRTPTFSMPSGNRPLDRAYEREWKQDYANRRKQMLDTYGASLIAYTDVSALDCTPEEQDRILEEAWTSQKASQLLVAFVDVMTDPAANAVVAEFVRRKIRTIVKDPETAELLCPKTYPIGGKRLCIDNGYYEMYNRDNVTLVDVRSSPIVAYTPTGLRTQDASYDLDVIVTATGFDAITGAMTRIDIEGVDQQKLTDKWAHGPTTYLGAMVAGFPNLFMIHGPMTPAAQAQMITTGEWLVDWTAGIIDALERDGYARIDTTEQAEKVWADEVDTVSQYTLHRQAASWYNGKNIEGKDTGFMIYVAGFPRFAQFCTEAVANGFEGFVRS